MYIQNFAFIQFKFVSIKEFNVRIKTRVINACINYVMAYNDPQTESFKCMLEVRNSTPKQKIEVSRDWIWRHVLSRP